MLGVGDLGMKGTPRSRGVANTVRVGLCHPEFTRQLWVAAVAILAIGLSAGPVSAQTASTDDRWIIQGGPYGGAAIIRTAFPEFGVRFGASRGSQVLDLRVSTFQVRSQPKAFLPPERKWRGYEALVGLGWQPGLLGIGVRSGLNTGTTVLGNRWSGFVAEPHTALTVPLGSLFELRGEAGVQFVVATNQDRRGFIGKIRVGVERRRR